MPQKSKNYLNFNPLQLNVKSKKIIVFTLLLTFCSPLMACETGTSNLEDAFEASQSGSGGESGQDDDQRVNLDLSVLQSDKPSFTITNPESIVSVDVNAGDDTRGGGSSTITTRVDVADTTLNSGFNGNPHVYTGMMTDGEILTETYAEAPRIDGPTPGASAADWRFENTTELGQEQAKTMRVACEGVDKVELTGRVVVNPTFDELPQMTAVSEEEITHVDESPSVLSSITDSFMFDCPGSDDGGEDDPPSAIANISSVSPVREEPNGYKYTTVGVTTFTAEASNNIESYRWRLEENQVAFGEQGKTIERTGRSVNIRFNETGHWDVYLTVEDSQGREDRASMRAFGVEAAPEEETLTARITKNPEYTGNEEDTTFTYQNVVFSAADSTGFIEGYDWTINGETLEGETVSYQPLEPGQINVSLTVQGLNTFDEEGSDTTETSVKVFEAPNTVGESPVESDVLDDGSTASLQIGSEGGCIQNMHAHIYFNESSASLNDVSISSALRTDGEESALQVNDESEQGRWLMSWASSNGLDLSGGFSLLNATFSDGSDSTEIRFPAADQTPNDEVGSFSYVEDCDGDVQRGFANVQIE